MSECLGLLLNLSEEERRVLEVISRSRKGEARLVLRARLLLVASASTILADVARACGVTPVTAKSWIRRFRDGALKGVPIEARLMDAPKSGAPPRFSAEQLCEIMAVACEDPAACGRPITHWTAAEIADEAQKREIIRSISPRHVGRFLKRCRP